MPDMVQVIDALREVGWRDRAQMTVVDDLSAASSPTKSVARATPPDAAKSVREAARVVGL